MLEIFVIAFIAYSWLTPLHFLPWVSWHSEVSMFAAILMICWHWVLIGQRNLQFSAAQFPPAVNGLIGLAICIWFQWTIGQVTFVGDAVVCSMYLLLCVGCLACGFAMAAKKSAINLLAATMLGVAFVSSLVVFEQALGAFESSAWIYRAESLRRPGGNIAQPNQICTLLLMGVVSLHYLYEKREVGKWIGSLSMLILLTAVAATESRTGILSWIALNIWWFSRRRVIATSLNLTAALLFSIYLLFVFWSWPSFWNTFHFVDGRTLVNTSTGTRWAVWQQLVEALIQRPWGGWGFGQVSAAHNAVADAYANSEPFTYAHNIVLDLALGIGIPLTTLLGLALLIWLWNRMKQARQLTSWYCLALILPFLVHSMLEFPFAYAYFLVPVMFAIGALEGILGSKPVFHLGAKPVAVVLLGATVIMAWSALEYVSIEEDFRIVRFEALKLGSTPSDYERPKVVLLTQLDALLKGGRIVPKPGMSAGDVELARTVALRYPWPATQSRYALSLALNGNPNEAIRQLRVMRALHGEKTYAQVRDGWVITAAEKYPQLRNLQLP